MARRGRSLFQRCRRACRAGAAAVEFALVLPVIMVLAIGAVSYGPIMFQQMMLEAAVRAGATFANVNGNDTAGITAAVQNAVVYPPQPSVTLAEYCTCANDVGGFGTTVTVGNVTVIGCPLPGDTNPCIALDPTDTRVLRYIRIEASEPVWFGGVVPPGTLSAATILRLE